MLVLKILGVAILLAAVLASLNFFNGHCDEKFAYRFFSVRSFWATVAALGSMIGGNWWRINALQTGGDVLDGMAVMGIGAVLALGLGYCHCKRTNLAYGLGGTALQLSAFGVLAYFGVSVLVVGLVLWFLSNSGAQHLRIVNN